MKEKVIFLKPLPGPNSRWIKLCYAKHFQNFKETREKCKPENNLCEAGDVGNLSIMLDLSKEMKTVI